MADFDIGVWTTYELYHHWKNNFGADIAGQAVWDYLEKNIESDMGYSVSVDLDGDHPNPPVENLWASDDWPDYKAHPCTGESTYYETLHGWFIDWHECNNKTKYDINLFVTDERSTAGLTSGNTSDKFFCSAEGSQVGALHNASWDAKGPEIKYSQMYATVLHEVGHAITENGTDGCVSGTWNDEYIAFTYQEKLDGELYDFTSPMVTWKDTNECCNSLMEYKGYGKAFDREYSSCLEDHVRPV